MKLAVISDIHGNVLALEAVIADLKQEAPDAIVNLGDCLSGPLWPEETAAMLRDMNWPTIRGNHDRVVSAGHIPPENRTDAFTAAALSNPSHRWLAALPPTIRLSDEIFLCHGTPEDDSTYLMEEIEGSDIRLADDATIQRNLGTENSPVICCGHSHVPRLVHIAATGQTVFNPGSVGLPGYFDDTPPSPHKVEAGSPHARYGLMEKTADGWRYAVKVLPYPWEKAAAEAEKNRRPDWARPLRSGFYGTPGL